MTTTTAGAALVERQIAGFNSGNIDEVMAVYADDATFVLVSPHTLPGAELRLEGKEKIAKHLGRVLSGGIENVELTWIDGSDSFVAWIDTGAFGPGVAFSESHAAQINDAGLIAQHTIHSIYAKG
jgi:hypothetical protein